MAPSAAPAPARLVLGRGCPGLEHDGRVLVADLVVSAVVPNISLAESVQDNLRLILRALKARETPDLAAAHTTGQEQAAPSRAIDDAALADMAAEVWQLARGVADAVTAAYRDAVAEMVLRDEHRRSVLVEALLSGEIADQRSLWETAHALRLPVEGRFLVVAR